MQMVEYGEVENPVAGLEHVDEEGGPQYPLERLTAHAIEMMDRMRRRTSKGQKFG
jgi:hypothetical protein